MTVLEDAIAALQPGDAADVPDGQQSAFTEADLSWQSAFHHDDLHGLIHLMGKPANTNMAWKHQAYDIGANTWGVISSGQWNNPGHIFGATALDHETGDLLQVRGGAHKGSTADQYRRAGWWQHAAQAWGYTTSDILPVTLPMESHSSGAAWHPNLYGAGDGGLVWANPTRTYFWRKSTGVSESVAHGDIGRSPGVGVYWPHLDAVIVGGAFGKPLGMVVVGGIPVVMLLAVPPISTMARPLTYGEIFGSLHVSPSDPSKMQIIERSAGYRVFETSDGLDWQEVGQHAFQTTSPFAVCSLRGDLGAYWAVGRKGAAHYSKLWRPI